MYSKYAELRDALGLTDYRVCKDLNISRTSMSEWKKTGSIPKAETLAKIAEYFHKPMEYFMR